MKIKSRGDLVNIINNFEVETYPVYSEPGTRMVNTIIYDYVKDMFCRLKWGEVVDKNGVYQLWYDDEIERVRLNETKLADGWNTRYESDKIASRKINKMGILDIHEYDFHNVERNLVNLNNEDLTYKNLKVVGGLEGAGKTRYAIKKTVETICEGKSILFFSTEESESEILDRINSCINENSKSLKKIINGSKSKDDVDLDSNITIYDSKSIDINYIVDKMINFEKDLDFVVVDSLSMAINTGNLDNHKEIINIHSILQDVAEKLNCNILVTTQLNNNIKQ